MTMVSEPGAVGGSSCPSATNNTTKDKVVRIGNGTGMSESFPGNLPTEIHNRIANRSSFTGGTGGTGVIGAMPFSRSVGYKSKSSDLSNGSGCKVSVSDVGNGAVHPHNWTYAPPPLQGRPRRSPPLSAVAPGTDPGFLMRHRRSAFACDNESNEKPSTNAPKSGVATNVFVPLAILLWYLLGVISIASSKVLLSSHDVPPLLLTLQQLMIGMTMLRTLLGMQQATCEDWDCGVQGNRSDAGVCRTFGRVQPIPMQGGASGGGGGDAFNATTLETTARMFKRKSSDSKADETQYGIVSAIISLILPNAYKHHIHAQLLLAAIYFALGFLFTNYGFQSGSPAFVETVKAAEPITSATTAVVWGIERLGK